MSVPRRRIGVGTVSQDFAVLRSSYDAARPSRFRRTRTALGGSADAHYDEATLYTIREYSRDMVRNDDVPGALLDAVKRNVLQDRGLGLEPQTGDRKLDEELWYRWDEWGSDPRECDARGMHSWWSLQGLVLEGMIVDGDLFALPLDSGQLQVLEAELCSSPTTANKRNVICGIVHDEDTRRPLEYWFSEEDNPAMRGRRTIGQYRQIPAYDEDGEPNVFHILDPRRISQSRGVPAFAPIFDTLGQFEDINFAALVQQQIVSCIAAFITQAGGGDTQFGSRSTQTGEDGTTEYLEALAPGLVPRLQPGEDVKGFSPNVPAPAYFELSRSVARRICTRLGVPPEIAFFDTTDTTFHGYRGAVDQARVGFQVVQRNIGQRFASPVYRWKVRQWLPSLGRVAQRLAMDTATRRATLYRHRWDMPGWRYVEPLKDAHADVVQLTNNLESPRGIAALRGRDHDDIIRETVEDNEAAITSAIKAAERIRKATGIDVSWRDILNRAPADRINISGNLGDAPEPETARREPTE